MLGKFIRIGKFQPTDIANDRNEIVHVLEMAHHGVRVYGTRLGVAVKGTVNAAERTSYGFCKVLKMDKKRLK